MAMRRAVTLMKAYGCGRVSSTVAFVTVFTTPPANTANTVRAASTEIRRNPPPPQIPAHLVCVTMSVPHIVNLITESVSVSQGWLGGTVSSACWDTGVWMSTVASHVSVLGIVTLTPETV